MVRILTLILTFILSVPLFCSGQSVGLVLSGGGAKGLYHIGVIRALEENNIPIDYITGTSIGAIVGGLYAIGYSTEEMEKIFRSREIKNWMTGTIHNDYKYYFKQMYENAAMFTLRFDFSKKGHTARLPSNLIPTNQLDLAFIEIFTPATVKCEGDFDRLFVPFRCVATDAAGRRQVVFKKGDVGKAIRASMTVPLLFRPIRTDSTTYYDGGMFDNFPWKPMLDDFSPDIIIGSNPVQTLHDPNETNMIEQVFELTTLHTDYNLPRNTDVMITRTIDNLSTMDFEKAIPAIQMGYDDTMEKIEEIKRSVNRRASAEEVYARRVSFRDSLPPLLLGNIEIEGLTQRQKGYVRKLLRLHIRDEKNPYSLDDFRSEYFKILAEGEIDGDYPQVVYNSTTQKFDLKIKMTAKPSFKLMVGGNISSTALNQAYAGIEYKTISGVANSYNLDGYFSSFYSSAQIGGRMDFFIKSPFYWDYGGSLNYYNYFRSNYGFLSKGHDLTYSKYRDYYGTISAGLPASRHNVLNLRMNVGLNEYQYFQNTGYNDNDTMDMTRFRYVGWKLAMDRKNQNFLLYPTRGIAQSISLIAVGGKETFTPGSSGKDLNQTRSEATRNWLGARFMREHYLATYSLKWFSWGYMVDAVITNHPSFSNEYSSNISSPAFTPTQHSKIVYMKEFRSNSYIAGGLILNFEFTPNIYLKYSNYAFLPENYDGVKEKIRQRMRYIFDASLVYQTILGPISLSVSKYDVTSKNNWFMTFNFGYALFNKKGLFY